MGGDITPNQLTGMVNLEQSVYPEDSLVVGVMLEMLPFSRRSFSVQQAYRPLDGSSG